MKMRGMIVFMAVLSLNSDFSGGLKAYDGGISSQDESVKKLGVAWNIAEDRKIGNYAGVYQPEGLDVYMKRYFDRFSVNIDLLTQKINHLNEQTDRLEKKVDDLLSRSSSAQAAFAGKRS